MSPHAGALGHRDLHLGPARALAGLEQHRTRIEDHRDEPAQAREEHRRPRAGAGPSPPGPRTAAAARRRPVPAGGFERAGVRRVSAAAARVDPRPALARAAAAREAGGRLLRRRRRRPAGTPGLALEPGALALLGAAAVLVGHRASSPSACSGQIALEQVRGGHRVAGGRSTGSIRHARGQPLVVELDRDAYPAAAGARRTRGSPPPAPPSSPARVSGRPTTTRSAFELGHERDQRGSCRAWSRVARRSPAG